MLFTQIQACSPYYDPSVTSMPQSHPVSCMDCCRHIVHTVDYLMEHGCLDTDIIGNHVHIVVSDIPEATLHRTAEDINRIVFYGKEFERKLALLGIHRRKQEQTLSDLRYLQMCYFLYLMDYIIYPDVRFFDLFKVNNLSSENVSDAGTGNEKYQDMILQVILQNPQYRKINDDHEHAFDVFQDSFFSWYELSMYSYMEQNNISSDTGILPATNLNNFSIWIHDQFRILTDDIIIEPVQSQHCVFDDVLATIKKKEASAVLQDYGMNLDQTDYSFLHRLSEKIMESLPKEYETQYITYDQIPLIEQDKEFISILRLGKDRKMPVSRFIETYQISDAVKRIWDFENDQLKRDCTEGQFTFLQEMEGQYVMSMKDVFILCMVRIHLPTSVKYYTKQTDLYNRSDGNHSFCRSIKQSFKATESDDYNPSNSALRDDIFRILCRATLCIMESSLEEFFHYELPMNRMLTEVLKFPEDYPFLQQRTAWFTSMAEIMHTTTVSSF